MESLDQAEVATLTPAEKGRRDSLERDEKEKQHAQDFLAEVSSPEISADPAIEEAKEILRKHPSLIYLKKEISPEQAKQIEDEKRKQRKARKRQQRDIDEAEKDPELHANIQQVLRELNERSIPVGGETIQENSKAREEAEKLHDEIRYKNSDPISKFFTRLKRRFLNT